MIEDIIRNVMNMPPSRRRVELDLATLEEETRDWHKGVIPWERENELELFSLNHDSKWFKHRGSKMLKGVFYSIYNEAMLVFGYKNYMRNDKHGMLWAATASNVFIYRTSGQRTEFYINGDRVGYITPEGLMYGGGRGRLLGRRNDYSDEYYSVVIWDREVANLLKAKKAERVNPRAFEVMEEMNKQEFLLLLTIGFWTLISESFELDPTRK